MIILDDVHPFLRIIFSIRILLLSTGIDINAHDIRFVEDNWESPVSFFCENQVHMVHADFAFFNLSC